jgi:phosphoglycolate phosphatase-like HAD superfamily hydrolase
LKRNETGIIVFDIDDTLLKANSDIIKIYKKDPSTGKKVALSTEDFAKDPDVITHPNWFDCSDFDNEEKVYRSIVEGTPIVKNLKILDAYIKAGYHFCFLTARGCEETVKNALREFVRYKDESGQLHELADKFKEHMSAAVNDKYKGYPGTTDAEKKANVLRNLCNEYDKVIFVDDDIKNVEMAKSLKLNNLKIIKAHK